MNYYNAIIGNAMEHVMRSTITSRGQTVVPAEVRRRFALGPADGLEWVIDDGDIRVVPVRRNPVAAFRGQGKGGASRRLLEDRKEDAALE